MMSFSLSASPLRWLYVDFNSYFASVEQQLQPRLRGKPIAVVPVETDATCAIAASYEAKAYGIKTGTPIYQAKRLCPELICVLANHEHYVDFHLHILEEIERHIPITLVGSIDEVACRLMDNETDITRATAIAHSIKQGLAERLGKYVRCSIGIAPNRYLAKVATELQKPDGFVVLSSRDLPHKLFTLKLRDLPGIGSNIEQRLRLAGIGDMQALWALEPKQMRMIWGNIWGEKLWYLLRGKELPEEETVKRTIGHSHVMAPELRDPAKAMYVARRLTLKAASRLRRLGYFAASFHLSIRTEKGVQLAASEHCYRAQDSMTFLALLHRLWQQCIKETQNARIKKISITLHELIAATDIQPELFTPLPKERALERRKSEKISHAMDTINHRFGRDSVLLGMLPSQGKSFSGSKISFTRIPDKEEFLE